MNLALYVDQYHHISCGIVYQCAISDGNGLVDTVLHRVTCVPIILSVWFISYGHTATIIWTGFATAWSYGHVLVQSMWFSLVLPPMDERLLCMKVSTNVADNSCFLDRMVVGLNYDSILPSANTNLMLSYYGFGIRLERGIFESFELVN